MSYREKQRENAMLLIARGKTFESDPGNGMFRGKPYPYRLRDATKNLYAPIRDSAKKYFEDNHIVWWGGGMVTNHPLSSQVACLNHLFSIRNDQDAVHAIIHKLEPSIVEIMPVAVDAAPHGFIAFEVASREDYLNELKILRGGGCTSIDALILGRRSDNRVIMFPIEWKYTEFYYNTDYGRGREGIIRKSRYDALIADSAQLTPANYNIYYYEPFFQLMRQTLWAEQVLRHKETERIKADDFIHLHVIPEANTNLLNKVYPVSGMDMETTWRGCLREQGKYRIISPEDLLCPINSNKYENLLAYLQMRYWR